MNTSDNNEGSSKSNDDDVCEVNVMLQNMSTEDGAVSICANCGKEGSSDNMNTCNKCKMVKYCNAVCKKVHKKKHKKDCEEHVRLAAEKHKQELRLAAEKHDIELFKQPPPLEDCPICFVRLPTIVTGYKYKPCCGKVICSGCSYAPVYDNQGNKVDNDKQNECAFCRTLAPKSDEEAVRRLNKRMEANDPFAIHHLGVCHAQGSRGLPLDYKNALELWHRAAELGDATAYCNIGDAYQYGKGVKVDKKKARYYYELAAMGGDVCARYCLGYIEEYNLGNTDRAVKHYMIAVGDGDSDSLTQIKELYSNGYAKKEDFMKALQSYQAYLGEIKSRQRDEAAAINSERYRYY